MNNKGFGIGILFVFIILVFFSMFALYSFIKNVIQPLLYPKTEIPNYKNEYRIYLKGYKLN